MSGEVKHFALEIGEGVTLPGGRLRLTSVQDGVGAFEFTPDAAGVHVINPERTPEGITPGMREAAERIARSVVGDPHGLQRSTTTRQAGPLTLNAVPCLKDPESGEVFFTPDVTAVLVSLAGALKAQG